MTLFAVFVCDPHPKTPQFDWQLWQRLPWEGTAIPNVRKLGEWAWVGREPNQSIRGAQV